jgi:hypothetical protein
MELLPILCVQLDGERASARLPRVKAIERILLNWQQESMHPRVRRFANATIGATPLY